MTPVTHFNLEITNLCNQRCVYCFNNSGPLVRKIELPTESWKRFLKCQAEQGLRSVHITGGEPFVNGRAIELIDAAQRLGLSTSVLSNGYRVPELIDRFGEQFKKLSVVQISLDSAHPEIHDARRGKSGAWRQALAAIRALRRARIPCEVSCTTSQENLRDVKRLAIFCRRLGLKLIVRPLAAFGRGRDAALEPVHQSSFREVLAEVERQNPGTITRDRFCYVPDGGSFDSKARERGIVTVLPNGRFRAGRVFFPKLKQEFATILDTLSPAANFAT